MRGHLDEVVVVVVVVMVGGGGLRGAVYMLPAGIYIDVQKLCNVKLVVYMCYPWQSRIHSDNEDTRMDNGGGEGGYFIYSWFFSGWIHQNITRWGELVAAGYSPMLT